MFLRWYSLKDACIKESNIVQLYIRDAKYNMMVLIYSFAKICTLFGAPLWMECEIKSLSISTLL